MELNIRNQENKEFFDEKAEGYDEVHKPFMNTKNLLTENIDIICGDFFSIDFGQNIDVIMSTSALHHFLYAEKLKLYKKIYNSLRSGGIFINSDYTAKDEEEEKQCIYNYEHKVNRHNDTPLSLEHELEILKQIGFIDIEVKQPEKESYKLIKARK